MHKMAGNLLRRFPYKSFLPQTNYVGVRTLAKYAKDYRIVVSDDGGTIVCWHPEEEFPYEKSLPVKLDATKSNDVLNVKKMKDIMSFYDEKNEDFVREELMRLTYTTKHRWFPEGIHKRRRKRNFEESRKYL